MDQFRYDNLKRYSVPSSLDSLRGPELGSLLHLDHSVIWAPECQTIKLDSLGDVKLAYTALINEGTSQQQERSINKALLLEVWPTLTLPWRVYDLWENNFPELPQNVVAHA